MYARSGLRLAINQLILKRLKLTQVEKLFWIGSMFYVHVVYNHLSKGAWHNQWYRTYYLKFDIAFVAQERGTDMVMIQLLDPLNF